ALAGHLPDTSEVLYGREVDKQTKTERKIPYVVQKRTLLTGAELTRAEVSADPNSMGNWQVAIEFTSTGTRIFGEVTEQNVGRRLAIILDGTVYSAPRAPGRRGPRPEPPDSLGLHGGHPRDLDLAGPGRHRADDRHGRRHEHPDLRADPGRAAGGEDSARVHRGRVPPRAADDRGHAPHRHGDRDHSPVVRDQLGDRKSVV